MKYSNPYQQLPTYTRWSKSVAAPAMADVDPVVDFGLKLSPETLVATGGSCFAQHIARHLAAKGFRYYVVEEAHPMLSLVPGMAAKNNYGVFSARYGNIYTSRQLVQLVRRAFGTFVPVEEPWSSADGKFFDPFRPEIQPGGFSSLQEMLSDRAAHLAAVRKMFETTDVFVFTLGLTEFWYCKADGAVLPVCPGISAGTYSEENYGFANLTVAEVLEDLRTFIDELRLVNPDAKIILTVSPVPLAATGERKHVLVSTTYSKSVLRVAAEEIVRENDHVHYFPSYEVITGNYNRGSYYAANLRDVVEQGVEHVMRLFMQHATVGGGDNVANNPPSSNDEALKMYAAMERVTQVVCEEALIEASLARPDPELPHKG